MHRPMPTWMLLAGTCVLGANTWAASMDGVWRSQGYGYLFEIHGHVLKSFEVTSTTCVAGSTARLQNIAVVGREATFKSNEGDLFFFRAGAEDDHRSLHFEGSASDMKIDRLQKIPAVCDRPTPNTPLDNFEVFTRTFDEHYISFGLKRTDWKKVVADYRAADAAPPCDRATTDCVRRLRRASETAFATDESTQYARQEAHSSTRRYSRGFRPANN